MMWKRLSSFLLLLTVFVSEISLEHILPKHYDLNQLLVVNAIGIDKTEEGAFSLTFAYADSSKSDGVSLLHAEGLSFSSAVNNATRYAGRSMFLGHTRLVVIGHDAARTGLTDAVNYLSKSYETRLSVAVVTVDGKAKDCLSVPGITGSDPITGLDALLDSLTDNSLSHPAFLDDVAAFLAGGTTRLSMPLLKTVTDDQGQPLLNLTMGTAFYEEGLLRYELTEEDAYWYCLLNRHTNDRLLTCSIHEAGIVSVKVSDAKTTFKFLSTRQKVHTVSLSVELQVDVLESSGGIFDDEASRRLVEEIETYYTDSLLGFLNGYRDQGTDICYLGDTLRRFHPLLYENWTGVGDVAYEVNTSCQIKISYVYGGH